MSSFNGYVDRKNQKPETSLSDAVHRFLACGGTIKKLPDERVVKTPLIGWHHSEFELIEL